SPPPDPARSARCAAPWPTPLLPWSPGPGTHTRPAASRRRGAPPGPRCATGPRRSPPPPRRRAGRRSSRRSRPIPSLGEPPPHLSPQVARIEQHEIVDDHPVLHVAETVDQLGGVGASAADDNHL